MAETIFSRTIRLFSFEITDLFDVSFMADSFCNIFNLDV